MPCIVENEGAIPVWTRHQLLNATSSTCERTTPDRTGRRSELRVVMRLIRAICKRRIDLGMVGGRLDSMQIDLALKHRSAELVEATAKTGLPASWPMRDSKSLSVDIICTLPVKSYSVLCVQSRPGRLSSEADMSNL